jgi:hypothetical protein
MITEKKNNLLENIIAFDNVHLIKQIILIGEDGIPRNIELEFIDDDN